MSGLIRLSLCLTRICAPLAFSSTILSAAGAEPGPSVLANFWVRLMGFVALITILALLMNLRARRFARERDALQAALDEKDRDLAAATERLQKSRLTDTLTGIRNMRFFGEAIDSEVDRAIRVHHPLAPEGDRPGGDLIFVQVNLDDTGEPADSQVVEAARRLKLVARASDFLVRKESARFLVLTRGSRRENGHVVATKILHAIGQAPFVLEDGSSLRKTCSVGWAPFPWIVEFPDTVPYENVLNAAALAADQAQKGGGNRAIGLLPRGRGEGHAQRSRQALASPFAEDAIELVAAVETAGPGTTEDTG